MFKGLDVNVVPDVEHMLRAIAAGCDHYIAKPAQPTLLEAVMPPDVKLPDVTSSPTWLAEPVTVANAVPVAGNDTAGTSTGSPTRANATVDG